jgi:hypothetical protein
MTETQHTVDAIRDSMKSDWSMAVWFRSEHDRVIKRVYESADVLTAISEKFEKGLTPIASTYRVVRIGTTPETENHIGGFHE